MIIETIDNLLKFRLSEVGKDELKIIERKTNETVVGISVNDCESSNLLFWTIKNGVWKETTNSVIKQLGKKDIKQILKVSPANIINSNQTLGITIF